MLTVPRPLQRVFDLFDIQPIAWLIIFLNLVGFVVGTIYWYGPHFLVGKDGLGAPSPWLWIFIPDCPLFAFLFVIAFVALRRHKKWTWFYTITAIGLIKYGVWTVTFWVTYWLRGAPLTVEGVVMTVAHLGMIVQGVYLLTQFRAQLRDVLIALAWFVLSDYVDYGLGEYPRFYPLVPLWLMQWHTIAMTWILVAWVAFLSLRKAPVTQAANKKPSEVAPTAS